MKETAEHLVQSLDVASSTSMSSFYLGGLPSSLSPRRLPSSQRRGVMNAGPEITRIYKLTKINAVTELITPGSYLSSFHNYWHSTCILLIIISDVQ